MFDRVFKVEATAAAETQGAGVDASCDALVLGLQGRSREALARTFQERGRRALARLTRGTGGPNANRTPRSAF